MYPAKDARELGILLRISRELDIVGDVTATVDNPSELLAWTLVLANPNIVAWRAEDSGHRYLHVTADRSREPIRGCVTAVLPCEHHQEFWNALGLDQLEAGNRQSLDAAALSSAWAVMPITPSDTEAPQPDSPS
jgi:hypothetical protein